MFIQIIHNTPLWVWALLTALIALGYSQTRQRAIGLRRAIITPVAMVLLSLYGMLSAFGPSPVLLCTWLAASSMLASWVMLHPAPAGTAYSSLNRQYVLPGSWLPMAVILGIFFTKYAVNVTLAIQPAMAQHSVFATLVGMVYGLFSGFFAGRALRLLRLAMPNTEH
jgi:hypothetical protein